MKQKRVYLLEAYSSAERVLWVKAATLSILLAFLDQMIKCLIVKHVPFHGRITVIDGFFDITHITNPGAAWGLFANRGAFLLVISLLVLVVLIIFFRPLCDGWRERCYALSLIASGILGNSFDRIFRGTPDGFCNGEVVDFLAFHISRFEWPNFNLADACICIGVGIFILSSFIRPEKRGQKDADEPQKTA